MNTTQWSEAVQRKFPDAVPRADLKEEAFLKPASTEEMKQVICDLNKDSHTIGLELQVFVDNAGVLAGPLAVNRARDADTLTELTKMIITLIPKVEIRCRRPWPTGRSRCPRHCTGSPRSGQSNECEDFCAWREKRG